MLCDVCIGVIQHHRNKIHTWRSRRRGKDTLSDKKEEDEDEERLEVSAHEHLHHLTFSSLADSITAKCPICMSFWKKSYESDQESMRVFDDVTEESQEMVHSDQENSPEHEISSESEASSGSEVRSLTYMRIGKVRNTTFGIYIRHLPHASMPRLHVLESGMHSHSPRSCLSSV